MPPMSSSVGGSSSASSSRIGSPGGSAACVAAVLGGIAVEADPGIDEDGATADEEGHASVVSGAR